MEEDQQGPVLRVQMQQTGITTLQTAVDQIHVAQQHAHRALSAKPFQGALVPAQAHAINVGRLAQDRISQLLARAPPHSAHKTHTPLDQLQYRVPPALQTPTPSPAHPYAHAMQDTTRTVRERVCNVWPDTRVHRISSPVLLVRSVCGAPRHALHAAQGITAPIRSLLHARHVLLGHGAAQMHRYVFHVHLALMQGARPQLHASHVSQGLSAEYHQPQHAPHAMQARMPEVLCLYALRVVQGSTVLHQVLKMLTHVCPAILEVLLRSLEPRLALRVHLELHPIRLAHRVHVADVLRKPLLLTLDSQRAPRVRVQHVILVFTRLRVMLWQTQLAFPAL